MRSQRVRHNGAEPAIPLLGTYPERMETPIRKDAHPPVFTAALFTAAKTWERPACPSAGEWIKKPQTRTLSREGERNNAKCSSQGGPRGYHTK